MKKYFSKLFLDEGKKIQQTIQSIEDQKSDIFFFQEAGK